MSSTPLRFGHKCRFGNFLDVNWAIFYIFEANFEIFFVFLLFYGLIYLLFEVKKFFCCVTVYELIIDDRTLAKGLVCYTKLLRILLIVQIRLSLLILALKLCLDRRFFICTITIWMVNCMIVASHHG